MSRLRSFLLPAAFAVVFVIASGLVLTNTATAGSSEAKLGPLHDPSCIVPYMATTSAGFSVAEIPP